MKHYYNDIDPYVCRWLENLIISDLIPDGDVDGRSIVDVVASDVRGYAQAHFFCGIAGWPLALQLAGWPVDRNIWTGSCPCQPFSHAGEGKGFDDERHLWPHLYRLIRECRPAVVVGEQVASKDAEPWLDLVLADLEALDYAGAAVAFPSASVGAPHIRDRTYWMGHANDAGLEGLRSGHRAAQGYGQAALRPASATGGAVRVADAGRSGDERARRPGEAPGASAAHGGQTQQRKRSRPSDRAGGTHGRVADPSRVGFVEAWTRAIKAGSNGPTGDGVDDRPRETNGFWRTADWLYGRDAKWRPVEPGTFPLVDGVPARMEQLRAYGNAINPHQASEFLKAAMDCMP